MQKKQELETMTKKITPLALALVTLLTGCSMIPTYERPAAPVPTGFPNVTASERISTLPSWRTYFAEPRLQQLIELALNNNRDLRIASLNVEQARAQFQVTRIHPCGIVEAQAGLPCPAYAVVLRVVHAADQQRA